MGGYLALVGAAALGAAAVVAICPAGSEQLLRGLRNDSFDLAADRPALEAFFEEHDVLSAVSELRASLLVMHAEGDEQVPAAHSEQLFALAGMDDRRLLIVPGGHHRSIQHDPELQAEAIRFISRALSRRAS
jgi:fermentation-respiration switch protein FrsA (DUF1100 family)